MYIQNTLLALISIIFLGCSTASTPNNIKPLSKNKYTSQSGYYYVLIEKNNNLWKIVDIKESVIESRAKSNQEILQVNETYSQIQPYFAKTALMNSSNQYECKKQNNPKEYNICTSNLSTNAAPKNMMDILRSFDEDSTQYRYIDEKLVQEAIKQTNLFSAIESKKEIFEYDACKRAFTNAKTSDEFSAFIAKYSSLKSAQHLIALSYQNLDALKIEEQQRKIQEEQNAKAYAQKEKEAEIENIMLAKIEQKSINNFTYNIDKFRKNLKKGVETNCGPIVDLKDSFVKVYFPVKNYSDDHWISSNKIFPKGHGCKFVKGNYIAPATF